MEEQFKELLIVHRVFRDDEKTRRCIEAMKEVWNMAIEKAAGNAFYIVDKDSILKLKV